MKNLAMAIIAVMKEVKGIDKTMTVGTGINSYKGVPDKEVKKILGDAMAKNGLCVLPIEIKAAIEKTLWEEPYNGQTKRKQSVFTEVNTKYLLLHESGESIELVGYGHGVDSQDKGAGKATTYALKYTMLYTFFVPTGTIDDADTTHSDDHPVMAKPSNTVAPKPKPAELPYITDDRVKKACELISKGDMKAHESLLKSFSITPAQMGMVQDAIDLYNFNNPQQ